METVTRHPQQPQQKRRKKGQDDHLAPLTSDQVRHRLTYVTSGSTTILKLPSGRLKSAEILPGKTVSLGKFGSFKADDIIGMPFGFTYEIEDDGLKLVVDKTLNELELAENATNEKINDDGSAQSLTYIDIQQLKKDGLSGREIIQKQLEGSESFEQRTVYSQAKYVKRKEQKHLKLFTPLMPDFGTVCDFNFEKNPEKIRYIRSDALSQCLSFASVRPGGRYLVVDGVSGLLVGSVLERLAGDGLVLAINDAESPPAFDLLSQFNLPEQFTQPVLKVLHWAATQPEYTPVFSNQSTSLPSSSSSNSSHPTTISSNSSSKDRSRNRKRQANFRHTDQTRNDFFNGDFDAVLIASHYDTFSIIDKLKSVLSGSANVVVHSPYLQPLVECHSRLRVSQDFANISITEPWLRKYQVLPGRTHPEMTTSATAGFILHAIRVFSDEQAIEIKTERQQQQQQEQQQQQLDVLPSSSSSSPPSQMELSDTKPKEDDLEKQSSLSSSSIV